MSTYRVIKGFHDLQDKVETKDGEIFRQYKVGDTYPRNGLEVSEDRIKELSGKDNNLGEPVIEAIKDYEDESPKTPSTACNDTPSREIGDEEESDISGEEPVSEDDSAAEKPAKKRRKKSDDK